MSYSDEEAPTPFELNVEFEDLDPEYQRLLKKVFQFCLRRIAEAKEELYRALVRLSPKVARHFKIMSTESSDRLKIREIISNYNRIAGVLLGHEKIRYDGEKTGPAFGLGRIFGIRVEGYVTGLGPLDSGQTGEIKIVKPEFMKAPYEQKARIVIHEIAHKFLGMKDIKYYGPSSAIKISTEQALNNADSYANFAIENLFMRKGQESLKPRGLRLRPSFNLKRPAARGRVRGENSAKIRKRG
jgi:hypothetical protein